MNINVLKLKQGDLLETMRFSYCADKRNFVQAFSDIGIQINSERDLEALVSYKFPNSSFSLRDFVSQIEIRHSQVLKCSAKFV